MKPATPGPNATASDLLPLDPSIVNYHTCTHLISSYILPEVLHFLAFLLGFWYFRVQDNEQMDALIQQVGGRGRGAGAGPSGGCHESGHQARVELSMSVLLQIPA